ncbi:lipopolysaccharide biosynthesis protein [Vibrio kanaloae]|uniref:Flippase n=1 Tax=Vibrio kanaloae TaxID=170673 RepID=A0A4U1Z108_9VIBR|nr:oligosaccharide flippase family protein [Vibrio kanaloae]TKF25917.1 hypothetical protein FCV52_10500 [Vibrio kanaloae]
MKLINKDFINNFIGLSSMNLMALIVPLVTMPILSKSLGMELYGIFLLLLSINAFGQSFVNYSFGVVAVREISVIKDDVKSRSLLYSEIFSSQVLLSIIYLAFVTLLAYFDLIYLNVEQVFFYSYPVIISNVLFSLWFHQGVSETKVVAFLNILARLSFIIYCLFFVVSKSDLDEIMFFYAYSLFIASILSFFYRIRHYKINLKACSPFQRIREGKDSFIGLFSPNLYSNVPGLALPSLISESQYSIYAIAIRIINIANMAQNIISRSLLPVLSNREEYSITDVLKINLTVSIFISIGFLLLSDWVVNLLVGKGYEESVYYIKISVVGIVCLAIADSIANGFYLAKKRDKDYRKISIYVSVICFIISIPLVFIFKSFGAILILIFARVIFAIFYIVDFNKTVIKKRYKK